MRVIIAGTREGCSYGLLWRALRATGWPVTQIICGGCRGVDAQVARLATQQRIPLHVEPARWNQHGRAAGPIRNARMALLGDALLALPGKGSGTYSMIACARKQGLLLRVLPLADSGATEHLRFVSATQQARANITQQHLLEYRR